MVLSKLDSNIVILFLITGFIVFLIGTIGSTGNILFNDVRLDYNFTMFVYVGLGLIIVTVAVLVRDSFLR